ncbi:MAG: prepilin-type N-terminal cleavage/methylation domain-containing protein [Elusimicrobiaceae bacterium]|nr:prepilin-type N-terminal cleavage/methylation domain-containing protein [Elusimicrobiaceae bacterium]
MKKGFTVIELLVVVLIIGILAAVAIPQYHKAVEKSKAAIAISVLRELKNQQELHFLATGSYTSRWDELEGYDFTGTGNQNLGNFVYHMPPGLRQYGVIEAYLKKDIVYWLVAYPGEDGGIFCIPRANKWSRAFCSSFSKTSISCPYMTHYQCHPIGG